MKTMQWIHNMRYGVVALLLLACSVKGAAQKVIDDLHFTIDWQMNAPIATDYADQISGWGMNFETGYYLTPHWAVGAFINFHTNHQYVARATYPVSSTATLTTDQQQSAYQLPFGLSTTYRFQPEGWLRPYAAVKAGAMYAKNTTYFNDNGWYDNPWGFYVSPEVGLNIHPVPDARLGFHIAAYYSYATNRSQMLFEELNGSNNVGFRIGVSF